eukprot:CFRG5480T1
MEKTDYTQTAPRTNVCGMKYNELNTPKDSLQLTSTINMDAEHNNNNPTTDEGSSTQQPTNNGDGFFDDDELITADKYDIIEINEEDVPDDLDDEEDEEDEDEEENLGKNHGDMEVDDTEGEVPLVDMSVSRFARHDDSVYSLAISPADTNVSASGGGDDHAYIWRTENGVVLHELIGHTDSVTAVEFSFDGQYLATGGLDGQVLVWDVSTGKHVVSCEGCTEIEWLKWHTKGHVLLAGSSDGNVWLWKVPNGALMAVLANHTDSVRDGGFSSDGKSIFTCSFDGSMIIWDPKKATATVKFGLGLNMWFDCPVNTCDLSPDGVIAVAGGENGGIAIASVKQAKVLFSHPDVHGDESVEAIQFSPSHPYMASAGLDGNLLVWDTNPFKVRHQCTHGAGVVKVAWHPTEPIVFTGSLDHTVRAWDARTGECLKSMTGHNDAILCLALSSDGRIVATGSDDTTARVFQFSD